MEKKKERKHYLDWLRVIAFYILIFYHIGMIFVPWDFHIKNELTLEWFETWMAFFSQWRLPLLFIISGMVIYYSMGSRTWKGIIKERTMRLFIPLIFGMLVIVPPQIYYERISDGVQFSGYLPFWKTVFDFVPFPEGGSLSWHHLWYILYIFAYTIIALPLFVFLKSNGSSQIKIIINNKFSSHPNLIYLLIIPLTIFYFILAPIFPTTHALIDDWYNHSVSFIIFLSGFFISAFDGIWSAIVINRKKSLILSAIPCLILLLFVWGPTFEIVNEDSEVFFMIYAILKWIFIASMLFAILGYSKFILNKPSKLLSYLNESVYPFYILHQTVMIITGYYIIQFNIGVGLKFLLILISTFGGSLFVYELLIKRINLFRVLFGMKTKSRHKQFGQYQNIKETAKSGS